MKNLKTILTATALTLGLFTVTFTSCTEDLCKNVTCLNGGNCDANGACVCPAGFEGTTCQTLSRDKFVGTYNCSDACTTGSGSYVNTITASNDSVKVNLSNASGLSTALGTTTSVYGTCAGNKITIPSQSVVGATATTIAGSGTMTGNVIAATYTVTVGTVNDACIGTWTKQ